jgi:hypothetical protein
MKLVLATMMNMIIISSVEGIVNAPTQKGQKIRGTMLVIIQYYCDGWHRPVTGCTFQRLHPGIGEKAPVAILIKESK